jgi:hypothetical protein
MEMREHFDNNLRMTIGSPLTPYENYFNSFLYKGGLVKKRQLPNGNIENFYTHTPYTYKKFPEPCIYVVEYDPKTNIVVAVRIDSGEEACIMPIH